MKITTQQQENLNRLAERFGLAFIILYGSRARGTARPTSDLDIAVLRKTAAGAMDRSALEHELAILFPEYDVDMRLLDNAPPFFRYQVFSRGVLLAGDFRAFGRMKLYAIRYYQEDHAIRRLRDRLIERHQLNLENSI